jgi:hypothetical protein
MHVTVTVEFCAYVLHSFGETNYPYSVELICFSCWKDEFVIVADNKAINSYRLPRTI